MSLNLSNNAPHTEASSEAVALAAWHSLAWLVFANSVGVLIAVLLLSPRINRVLAPWTYGRWMPVHIDAQLYGWCSLPLVAFLFHVYRAGSKRTARWCRPILWIWSASLAIGAISWITGHSSGKLFLDWVGYPRVLFPLALIALWGLLFTAFVANRKSDSLLASWTKSVGLLLLLAIPFILYLAASPGIYPPVNPDSGGPTGASQLESTLVIIAVLLLAPFGLTRQSKPRLKVIFVAWVVFAAEALLCLGLGRADVSHHRPVQYLSLASLLVWLPLIPMYYCSFAWNANTGRWRIAFFCWWTVLVPTGWCLFLPGVLDRFKFTDGLVGHSLLAMAGFVSSFLIFAMVHLLGDDGWIFNGTWSFYVWHLSVLAYVCLMFLAGWHEGPNPAFNMTPGIARDSIYLGRLILGVLMLLASLDWLVDANTLMRERAAKQTLDPVPA